MKRFCAVTARCALAICVAGALAPVASIAQQGGFLEPELDLERHDALGNVATVDDPKAATAPGAILRGLDKVSGAVVDMQMNNGDLQRLGRLDVVLGECRYPAGNPSGDAFAYLVIREEGRTEPAFEGWMIASSPALNALDHPRYDIWVLSCTTS